MSVVLSFNYLEGDSFVSINEALYTPYGYLNIIDTASLLSITPTQILAKLSALNMVFLLTSHYTKYAVVRINQKALDDNSIRVRPTFNDKKECPFQQILLSANLIEYLKTFKPEN